MLHALLSTLHALVHLVIIILRGILFLFKRNETEAQRS